MGGKSTDSGAQGADMSPDPETFPEDVRDAVRALIQENADLRRKLDVAELRARQLLNEAREDPLTGLLNRRGIDNELKRAVDLVSRYGVVISMLFVDLDDFKAINDDFGHAVGDMALMHVAALFTANLRRSDVIARIGGDEFALLLWHTDQELAQTKAHSLSGIIAATPLQVEETALNLGASIGVTEILPSDRFSGTILSRADKAMYAVKEARSNPGD